MKKWSKKSRFVISFSFVVMGFLAVGFITQKLMTSNSQEKVTEVEKNIKKSPKRTPASIKPTARVKPDKALKKIGNRILMGDKIENESDIKYINKTNPEWQKAYTGKLLRLGKAKTVSDLKIEHQESLIQVKRKAARNLEHIKVSYLDENGNPFAFEALVDSETGSMVRSWNQTRYEFKKPMAFSIDGKALYKD